MRWSTTGSSGSANLRGLNDHPTMTIYLMAHLADHCNPKPTKSVEALLCVRAGPEMSLPITLSATACSLDTLKDSYTTNLDSGPV